VQPLEDGIYGPRYEQTYSKDEVNDELHCLQTQARSLVVTLELQETPQMNEGLIMRGLVGARGQSSIVHDEELGAQSCDCHWNERLLCSVQ